MDLGKAVQFVFEDEQWVTKVLLGALITLIPVFGQLALMGYTVAIIRNVMAGDPRPLPQWDDLGQFFVDGLMLLVVNLIYSIPILILICPLIGGSVAAGTLQESGREIGNVLATLMGILGAGFGCLMVLYGILLSLLQPVLQICYAETGEIGACLRFGEVFGFLFANLGSILLSILIIWVAGSVVGSIVGFASLLVAFIPCIGWLIGGILGLLAIPLSTWLAMFTAYVYGELGRQAGVQPSVA